VLWRQSWGDRLANVAQEGPKDDVSFADPGRLGEEADRSTSGAEQIPTKGSCETSYSSSLASRVVVCACDQG
jgi:hypothetical protein